tara:strand:- start:17 stop:442 length:426 start_codon:yes stop_codon:yes gene_type:complete
MNQLLMTIRKDTRLTVLAIFLALFIIFDVRPPAQLAEHIDSLVGRVVIILFVIILLFSNPVVGALGGIAAYELFRRSEFSNAVQYIPSEHKKKKNMKVMNQFPKSLEEEVVQNMLPTVSSGRLPAQKFVPKSDKIYGASKI